jgi:spore coat protein CotH
MCFRTQVVVALILVSFRGIGFAEEHSSDDRLGSVILDGAGDEGRLFQTLEGARILAESGTGYEAARVVAAIAERAAATEPGRQAQQRLNDWGLSIEDVRGLRAEEINRRVGENLHRSRENTASLVHVQNLLRLGLVSEAADALRQSARAMEAERFREKFGESLERNRVSIQTILADDNSELTDRLQRVFERYALRRRAGMLWIADREASEIAEQLLERLSQIHPDEEEERRQALEELLPNAVGRVVTIAKDKPDAASVLASLIVTVAPDSPSATAAQPFVRQLGLSKTPATNGESLPGFRRVNPKRRRGDEIFESEQVRAYRLEISEEAIQRLNENPKEYVRGTFHEGDTAYTDVGVRIKGGAGSFRNIDGLSKVAFTIKFNQFDSKQRFHGLRRIILNNAVQDSSYLHECVGYGIFRDAGIPAPRISYATLSVNGEPYGLYLQVEAVTEDFLRAWFSDTSGNLYEGPGDVTDWESLDLDHNGDAEDRGDLKALAEAIEAADENDPWSTLSNLVDVDAFARFLALEQILGHWDGYAAVNNYRVYRDPSIGKFVFLPHGCDQIFDDLDGDVFRDQEGVLARALVQTTEGRKRYQTALREVLDLAWNEDELRQRMASLYQRIRPYAASAEGKGDRNIEEFEHTVQRMIDCVSLRRIIVLGQLRQPLGHSWRKRRNGDTLPDIYRRED